MTRAMAILFAPLSTAWIGSTARPHQPMRIVQRSLMQHKLERPRQLRLERRDIHLAVALSGVSIARLEQRALRIHRNE